MFYYSLEVPYTYSETSRKFLTLEECIETAVKVVASIYEANKNTYGPQTTASIKSTDAPRIPYGKGRQKSVGTVDHKGFTDWRKNW